MSYSVLPTVFVHGWLGDPKDWAGIAREGDLCPRLPIDTLPERCHLVGYSMGGRIAMRLRKQFPERVDKTVIISAHPGLPEEERAARWALDLARAEEIRKGGLPQFLNKWYNSPLFTSLRKTPHFPEVLERRLQQDPEMAIELLLGESLGKQEPLWDSLDEVHFLFGERDERYAPIYERLKVRAHLIPGCGHALHLEEPALCRETLERLLYDNPS